MVGFGVEPREGEVDDAFDLSILVALLDCARVVATRSSVERNFLKWFSVGLSQCALLHDLGLFHFGANAPRETASVLSFLEKSVLLHNGLWSFSKAIPSNLKSQSKLSEFRLSCLA